MEMSSTIEIRHSWFNKTSYGISNLIPDFIGAILGVVLFIFYETEIGLNTLLTGAALIIFAVWDAINDPVVGYLSDRPYRFTKKWGRRFPLVIGSFVPMVFLFVLIFYPPLNAPQWGIFLWLIVMTCLFDTLESVFVVNIFGLFPEKFRIEKERITVATIVTYFVIFGTILGTLIPPLIISFISIGAMNPYVIVAWATVVISLIVFPFLIPGARDDKEAVNRFLENYKEEERDHLFRASYSTLKQKNLIIYVTFILGYFILINSMASSLLYYSEFVLTTGEEIVTWLLGTMFGGALIGALIWLFYVRKTKNNKSVMVYGGLVMATCAIIFSFLTNMTMLYVLLAIQGLGVGGLLVMMTPTFSDVIDESVVLTKQRNEGLFGGFRFLAMNFGRVISIIILAVVHEVTGFIEQGSVESQPLGAILGIKLHTGVIPGIFMLIGVIVFWIFYDLKPEKTEKIKQDLKNLEL
jgi:GPH family glycoside/pentoside/hexuronide:cation symporter